MTHLEAVLAARAHRDGTGKRSANLRHIRIEPGPIMVLGWQLGAEAFSASALAFGCCPIDLNVVVTGEPRNRQLLFAALGEFARWFNPRFEAAIANRIPLRADRPDWTVASTAPQVVVPNEATIEFLGRLGRRLAYLPRFKGLEPDPDLIGLGRHLLFLERHSRVPGQQLIIPLTGLLSAHWVTPQTDMERMSLGALDAFIDPPPGVHGFHAAARAERDPMGPVPDSREDSKLEYLLQDFNDARDGRTDWATLEPLLLPIRDHYSPLIQHAWELSWRCVQREQIWPEAPSVNRRWNMDILVYTSHLDWVVRDGRRRTRQTPRQAAMMLRNLEEAKRRLRAEEAIDDSLRMIPYLLDHKAIEGRVIGIDPDHREVARVQRVRRPLVLLETPDPCLIPIGRELWWTVRPRGAPWVVTAVDPLESGGSRVTLKLLTSSRIDLPTVDDVCCFSVHNLEERWFQALPHETPWTHSPQESPATPEPLEESA